MQADMETHNAAKAQHSPFAPRRRHRREVGIEEMALLDVQLDIRGVSGKAG
jgi:hypothetical protein